MENIDISDNRLNLSAFEGAFWPLKRKVSNISI